MSSFYGGKEGRTYNIVQRYDSVAQMVEAFSGGGAYTGANYGQYVIIDTVLNSGRSNRENGLLYRRGFDYNQTIQSVPVKSNTQTDDAFKQRWNKYIQKPGAGAIYVGQIVGPEGRTPEVSIQQWSDFLEQFDEQGTGSYGAASKVVLEQTTTGKTDDEIKVGYVNIRDTHGDTTGGYIAIDIPKLVVEAEVVDHDAYSTAGVVEDSGSANHPLWYKWNFTIPDGKHGADLNGLSIETGEETGEDEDAEGNPIVNEYEYLTYSIKDYTDSAAGALTEHLGRWPYRVTRNISQNESVSRSVITWANDTQVSVGDLYREEVTPYQENCYWICTKAGSIKQGDFLPAITSLDQMGNYANELQQTEWCAVNIPQTAPAHTLIVDYTAGQNNSFGVRNVDYLAVDEDNRLYVYYSDSNEPHYLTKINSLKRTDGIVLTDSNLQVYYTNGQTNSYPLKQISSINFTADDGTEDSNLRIRYKDGAVDTYPVPRINNVTYNKDDLENSQDIRVNYIGGDYQTVAQDINRIVAMDRVGDNIIILYSSPTERARVQQGQQNIDWVWHDWKGTSYVWEILGSTSGKYHVQGEYRYADLLGDPSYSDYDETNYIDLSNGFQGDLLNREGWLVTVTDSDGEDRGTRRIFAFDYNDKTESGRYQIGNKGDLHPSSWYELMSLSTDAVQPNLFVTVSQEKPEGATLKDGMLWFVVSKGHDSYTPKQGDY